MSSDATERFERLVLEPAEAGARLDKLLAEKLGLSRARTLRLLGDGCVRRNGNVVGAAAKGTLIREHDRLELAAGALEERVEPNERLVVRELAGGPGWVVVDKPAGMAVHPLRRGEKDTVINAVAARYPMIDGVGEGGFRSGVVHRLDLPTSGALAVALDEQRWRELRRAFAEHRVDKRYLALVHGRLEGEAAEETWLRVAQHRPARVERVETQPGDAAGDALGAAPKVAPVDARLCRMQWRSLAFDASKQVSLLRVDLQTGFLHQIRAMLAAKGYPVVGDARYGDAAADARVDEPEAGRLMLHALALRYPALGIDVEAQPGGRMGAWIQRMRDSS